jgi:hypothetical protein
VTVSYLRVSTNGVCDASGISGMNPAAIRAN